MPILSDTGASIDIICEKFISSNMFTGENVWVQHILDEHMTCLPLAEVEIDYLEHNSLPRLEKVNAIQTHSQRKKEAEQNRSSESNEKVKMKLEENLAEDIENISQQKSEELAPLIQKVEKGMNNEKKDNSLTNRKLLIQSRKNKNGDIRQLLVIPEKFRSSILKMGHKGKANDQKKSPTQLNVDAVGPLPTTPTANKCLLTVMCTSSKYPDAVPMPDIASTTVVEALFQIFSRMGFPKEIQTDQGTSFTSIVTSVFFEN
ncbi:retrovirus-related Pol polyprotein from transposon 412 [Trichonephila inaurata madagascariensis]|uniref:Retrovirus-related Pol polyprotein from transposon 412 n=1 Tax=Trichonephila inaurata madagascariensis TaxID=2747483 RepID=A0A8X7C3K9_9ARAC|nr:retrovirus-related Pol polyprotein from transposon 412 [Trichonephila inaurata madagascariensis]